MNMKALLPALLLLSPLTVVSLAQEKAASDKKGKEPPPLVAIYRFYDTKLHEHVYSYGEGEPADWRKDPNKEGETIIGYASTVELPGTKRLWRAVRSDGHHYFYVQSKPKVKDIKLEAFVIYVWSKEGAGRVAIHGCSLPDSTDMFLDPDLPEVKKFIEGTRTGIGVQRTLHPNAFYLFKKPREKEETPKPQDEAPK